MSYAHEFLNHVLRPQPQKSLGARSVCSARWATQIMPTVAGQLLPFGLLLLGSSDRLTV